MSAVKNLRQVTDWKYIFRNKQSYRITSCSWTSLIRYFYNIATFCVVLEGNFFLNIISFYVHIDIGVPNDICTMLYINYKKTILVDLLAFNNVKGNYEKSGLNLENSKT